MKKSQIREIFDILKDKYGTEDLIELKYINIYTLLVSVILSAQATDKQVNKITEQLFEIVKNPHDMLKLGEENLKKYIKSINYYNNKAKNIIRMSDKLIKDFNSTVPNNLNDLMSLNGVGRKTANVVLNVAFGKSSIAVDTHVFRTVNRIGIVKADNVIETEKELEKVVPDKYKKYINTFFVLFGRYNCKAIKPLCDDCILKKYCRLYGMTKI
jgi:endonuclease-3